jgi:hypothetical protein
MVTVKFIRLSGDMSELTVNITETKTVGDLKKGYEKAHGVTAACQILLNMDAQEGEDEAAEVADEKELSGLSDELSLEAAHISEGTSLSLSILPPPTWSLSLSTQTLTADFCKKYIFVKNTYVLSNGGR